MKLSYRTMIEMRTTVLQEPGKQPIPLMQALLMAHGLPWRPASGCVRFWMASRML